jgi:hypothetical protein
MADIQRTAEANVSHFSGTVLKQDEDGNKSLSGYLDLDAGEKVIGGTGADQSVEAAAGAEYEESLREGLEENVAKEDEVVGNEAQVVAETDLDEDAPNITGSDEGSSSSEGSSGDNE